MDPFSLLESERHALVGELERLTPGEWDRPSMCEGWSNHVVVAHLNLLWSVAAPEFALGVLRARGNFGRAMDRFSRDLAARLGPGECLELLRENAASRRTPPGFGAESPITDLLVHGADILRPLGRSRAIAPEALRIALEFLTSRKAAIGFGARSITGLTVQATDVDLRIGSGDALLTGPALSLCGALLGRADYHADLSGDGVAVLAGSR